MRRLFWLGLGCSVAVFATIYGAWPLAFLALIPAFPGPAHRWRRLLLVVLGLCLGLLWPGRYESQIPQLPEELELTAMVTDWPWESTIGSGFTAQTQVDGETVKLQVYAGYEGLELQPGDEIQATARCVAVALSTDQLDNSVASKGIFWVAYLNDGLTSTRPESLPWQVYPVHWVQQVKDVVDQCFPAHVAGLVRAILTGDKTMLGEVNYSAIQRAGLAHGVAVSGMHLSFLTLFFVQILGRGHRRTSIVVIPILWIFVCMVGCSHSVVRAATMQTILLLAPLVNREGDSPTNLMTALMLILLQNPFAAVSVSLQLSFAATAGILLFTSPLADWMKEGLQNLWAPLRAMLLFFGTILATTLGALAFSMPLTMLHFGNASVVAVLSNLLALPAFEFVFLGGMLTVVVGLVTPVLGGMLALVVTPVAEYLLWLSSLCAGLPYAAVQVESGYFVAWLVVLYAIVLTAIVGKGWRRPILPLCCIIITFCMAAGLTRLSYTTPQLVLTTLDIGQGQAVVLHGGNRTVVIDCGGNDGDAGEQVADYLADRGIDRVDLLVLTHFHDDHANGVPMLFQRLIVDVLAVPEGEGEDLQTQILDLAQASGTQIVTITQDRTLAIGSMELTLYRPLGGGDANEAGLSILCQSGDFSALFTGDMDEIIEGRLIKYGNLPDLDFLMAGHHGSSSSTSQALLEATTPEVVVISVGENNYGHPRSDTLVRIDGAGADVYRTDLQGNVTLTLY